MGIATIGLTGFGGGALRERADFALHVPYANYGLVEDCHQILMHTFAQLFAREREAGSPPT
jgi:phosphoheptose isomerase